MLKHIVMMKLKPAHAELMTERQTKLKDMLVELKNHIAELETMEVGLNFSTRPQAMDLVLVSTFKTEEALNIYRVHPQHIDVLKYIDEVVAESKVVDYWI